MYEVKGNRSGMLVVPIVIFIGASVSLGITAASMGDINQAIKDAFSSGSNTLLIIGILLILAMIGLIIFDKRGSASYRWR